MPDFAFGFVTRYGDDPDRRYRTIMGYSNAALCPLGCPRVNFYSVPDLVWDGYAPDLSGADPPFLGEAEPYYHGPDGVPAGLERWVSSDAAGALSVHARAITTWKTSTWSDEPQFVQPVENANAVCVPSTAGNCVVTFQWAPVPGATKYRLQVGAAPSLANLYNGTDLPNTTTSKAVSMTLAQGAARLRARLWVELGSGHWNFRDGWFNQSNVFVPCSGEDPWLVPYDAFDSWGCDLGDPVCVIDPNTAELRCDLQAATTTAAGGAAIAITPRQRSSNPYDLLIVAARSDGREECCLYRDQAGAFNTVRLLGSELPDSLWFNLAPHQLDPHRSCLAAGVARGRQGGDFLFGSGDPELAESLFGLQGDDLIAGAGGDDFLHGGPGEDDIVGNDGQDLLLAGPGGGFDRLYGDQGNDILCSADPTDKLLGDSLVIGSSAGDTDVLYVSSVGFGGGAAWNVESGAVQSSLVCGHAVWTSVDAPQCPNTGGLTLPPAGCASEVPP